MRRSLAFALAVLALLLARARAQADDDRVVVVYPLSASEGVEGLTVAEAARDLLAASLAGTAGVRIVERERLDAVLAEQRVSGAIGQTVGDTAAPRIGALFAATHALSGTVLKSESGWRFTLSLMRVPDGAIVGTIDESGASRDLGAVAQKAAEAAATLFARDAKPVASLREDPQAGASLHYLRGLGFHRAGLDVEAVGEFLEAKRRASRFPETQFWTGEAYRASGRDEHAVIAFEAFLAEAPAHALAAAAREALAQAKEAIARRPAPPSRPMSLAETMLSDGDDSARAAAIARTIALGAEGVAALEAAVPLAAEDGDLAQITDAIAMLAPDRILPLSARTWDGRYITPRLRESITPEIGARFARGLLSRHAGTREPVVRVLAQYSVLRGSPYLRPETVDAIRVVVREAAESEDPGISLDGLRVYQFDKDALRIVSARVLNERYAASYRAEAAMIVEPWAWASSPICDAIVLWLGDERDVLRRSAWRLAYGGHIDASVWQSASKEERARIDAVPARFANRAREVLASRRFPRDAYDLSWVVRNAPSSDENADCELALSLWKSNDANERFVATQLPAWTCDRFETLVWSALDDSDPLVRLGAIRALPIVGRKRNVVEASFRRLLAWWRARPVASAVSPQAPPSVTLRGVLAETERAEVGSALFSLALAIRNPRPTQPGKDAGPDEWEAWFSR